MSRTEGRSLSLDEQRWLKIMILRLTALARVEPLLDTLYGKASEVALAFPLQAPVIQAVK